MISCLRKFMFTNVFTVICQIHPYPHPLFSFPYPNALLQALYKAKKSYKNQEYIFRRKQKVNRKWMLRRRISLRFQIRQPGETIWNYASNAQWSSLQRLAYSNRIINDWNTLSSEVIEAGTLDTFKARLDKHWIDESFKHPFWRQKIQHLQALESFWLE